MALFAVSLTLPVRLTSRQPGSVLTGRLESSLPAEVGGPVLDARLASQLLRGRGVARTRWAMTVRAPDPAEALTLAVAALRQAMGTDARSWDVAAMEATVKPAAASGRTAPLNQAQLLPVQHSQRSLSPAGSVQLGQQHRGYGVVAVQHPAAVAAHVPGAAQPPGVSAMRRMLRAAADIARVASMPKVTIPGLVLRTTADNAGHVHGLAAATGESIDDVMINLRIEAARMAQEAADKYQDSDQHDTPWQFEVVDVRIMAGHPESTGEPWVCHGTLVSAGKHPWDPGAWKIGQ